MPALALSLIPLIPGLVNGIMAIVDTIRNHDQTPDQVKAQLDTISAQLKVIVSQVAAVQLPDKQ